MAGGREVTPEILEFVNKCFGRRQLPLDFQSAFMEQRLQPADKG
jgi:hypothetical protein